MLRNLRGKYLQGAITFSAGSAYLLFGYDQPSFLDAIGNPSPSFLGLIVALYNIGCLAGCIVASLLGKKWGRRKIIIWGCVIMIAGGIIQSATYGAAQLIVGRLISGVGNGMNTSIVPVYVSECTRAKRRGRAVAMQLSIVIFGTVVAYWLDYGTIKHRSGEVVWRFPIAFQNVFALVTVATLPFLPETPRWLYSHEFRDEAISVLARLYDCQEDDPVIQSVTQEIESALRLEHQTTKFSIKDLINDKTPIKKIRRLFTGINVIAFYVTIVLETNVGLPKDTSSLVAGCIQIAFWLATFPPMFLLDRVGRSVCLLTAMAVFTAGIAVNTSSTSAMALAFLFIYEISFGMSWNAIPWLYAPEITPLDMRHVGSSIAAFSEWLWTFVIALVTPYAIDTAGWKFYLLFCHVYRASI
ncbi:hypothetical protein LB503_003436 [Fusarium chuoi]|nr:hypothetical protein LB503_003436 [Fusarium chuoi]